MRVAVVHDWLDTWRGGEAVLARMLEVFPQADLYALVDFMGDADRARLGGRRARTTFVQRLPFARRHFRAYLPLFPRAIESLDLAGHDVVLSSSHAVAKGVRVPPGALHVCYCYTPMRYAWDLQEQYLTHSGLGRGPERWLVRALLARLRAWDRATSARVHTFVAISDHIADRIRRAYGRESVVIHPPVAAPRAAAGAARGDAYVTVSQLVPYKRVDLVVEAFARMPDRVLVVIGEGPGLARLRAVAPPNVRVLGRVDDAERDRWLAHGRAFVFAAEEDFGIAPLEAQAAGMPVIAYRGGAAAQTVRGLDADAPTGVLFDAQTPDALIAAVQTFEAHATRITREACLANAARFAPERFRRALATLVEDAWRTFAAKDRSHGA